MLLAVLLATGCVSVPTAAPKDPFEREVRRLGLDPAELTNPVASNEKMREFARQVGGPGTPREQLARLQLHLFDPEKFPFTYLASETLTAAEAFEQRRGDCVAFTNLFIALGRSLSIPLKAALVFYGDTESEGDLVIVNTHIVSVLIDSNGSTFYDFARSRDRAPAELKILDDLWIGAIYLNNRGVEEIRAERYERARDYLEMAILLAPEFVAPYGNLGVALRKLGELNTALSVYSRALEIEARQPTILNNLAKLYLEQDDPEKAETALRAADLSGASPYLVIARGDLERSQGQLKAALRLYKRALRLDPGLVEGEIAIARLERERGRTGAARQAVERALEIAPGHPEAVRLQRELAAD